MSIQECSGAERQSDLVWTLMRLRILGAGLAAALAACLAPAAMAAFPGTNGRIVFASSRDGDAEIYSMNPDGSDQTNLSNNARRDGIPQWSPNGQKIVFESDRDDPPAPNTTTEIYVMDANGDNQLRRTNDPGYDFAPTFSPNGAKIAWSSTRGAGGDTDIWIMDANGTNQTQLSTGNTDDGSPVFSPDGTKIAFSSERGGQGQSDIIVMDADGTHEVNLTNSAADTDGQPAWSPDGQKIVFESTRDHNTGGGVYDVFSMNANGSSPTNLTHNAAIDSEAAFSPDGNHILFSSSRGGHYAVWQIDPNGANPTNLTGNTHDDTSADWAACASSCPPGAETASLSDSGYAVGEASGHLDVAVRRAGGLDHATTVHYATSNGSAAAGSDYESTNGTASFAIGQTETTFSVPVTGDSADEGDETFGVALSSPSGTAQLTSPSTATVTIVDDDSATPAARPDTSITSGPSGSTWVDQPQFGFASSIPGASFRCRTDGQVYAPCTSPYSSPRLTAGDHTFSVYAIGADGAADPTPATRSFHLNSAETRRAGCEVSPFQAVDNGRGTGDLKTTCEISFGERPNCLAYKVCEYRPNDECPFGAICTLGTTASWKQVERSYLAVAYANSRLEQTSPPLTVSGRFSHSCRTVTDCSADDNEQALGRAPMVSTCSALVTVPSRPGYVQVPPRAISKPSRAAAASTKLGCSATLKISPAPAAKLFVTAGRVTTFLPAAGRLTVSPLSGKSSAARKKKAKKKRRRAAAFRPIAATVSGAGAIAPALKLGKSAKRTLKRKRRLKVSVRVKFVPRSGTTITKTQTLILKPQAKRPRRCVRHKRRGGRPKVCVPRNLR
jgi:Tol biopolymer transport system component